MSTPEQQQVLAELEALRTRVLELEASQRARRRAWRRAGLVSCLVVFASVGTALAANGNCPNNLPFCFAADQPAQASQVNHNFAQLLEWLEAKTGTRSAAGVQTPSVTTTGNVEVTNSGQIVGTGNGNFHINTMPSAGTLYLNWHSGSGGVIVGNGASAPAVALQANGNVNLTSVNGRRPAVTYANACSTGSCTQACQNSGVIRQAWGFHGANAFANVGGGWACGGGIQWMGACLGQSSCTVTTACGSSSVWIDCW